MGASNVEEQPVLVFVNEVGNLVADVLAGAEIDEHVRAVRADGEDAEGAPVDVKLLPAVLGEGQVHDHGPGDQLGTAAVSAGPIDPAGTKGCLQPFVSECPNWTGSSSG